MSWNTDFGFEDLISPGGGGSDLTFQSAPSSRSQPRYGISTNNRQGVPQSSSGRMSISELSLGIADMPLCGVIIAKEDARSFPNKKDPGTERHLLSFTIRDSETDSVNVTCWGSLIYVQDLASQYHIGDVVELTQFVVQSKPTDGTDEKFRPSTSGPFQMSVSENRSTLSVYQGPDTAELSGLSHALGKAANDYYTISDILTNGKQLHGQTINIMAVVRSVGQVREITTKMGKHLKRCEVKLLDETAPNFLLNLWSEEIINMAQTWIPKDNVIFAADVRVTFDDYKKTMVATANSKTVITANPDTREAHSLYRYGQTVQIEDDFPSDDFSGGAGDSNRVDLSSIQTVFTSLQAKERQELTAEGGVEYGIIYCHVSRFDIDSDAPVSITRCSKCKRRVSRDTLTCENADCPQGSLAGRTGDLHGAAQQDTFTQYHVTLDLTDSTATLPACLLTPDAAEKMLQCSVADFSSKTEQQRTNLKWDYLLERCKVYIKLVLPTYERRQSSIRVLSCARADLQEAIKFFQ